MPRLFLPLQEHPDKDIQITGEDARYLRTVLRCKKGETMQIFDGKGTSYNAIIKTVSKKEVIAQILTAGQSDTESPLGIVLIQGLLKGDKMELVIQKTTELGVKEIIPAVTERSQVRDTGKAARWKKIAENAARQSGRICIPSIREPARFKDVFSEYLVPASSGLIFWEEKGLPLKEAIHKISSTAIQRPASLTINIFIGPEGGFTKDEVHTAESKGFKVASLGNRILRAETAAISATAIVQSLLGDI